MFDRLVLHHATISGERVALDSLATQWSFSQLAGHVGKIAAALGRLHEVKPRLVAIQCDDLWRHWLLILALGRLGLASASLPPPGDATYRRTLEEIKPDLVIVHGGQPPSGEIGVLSLDENWFQRALALDVALTPSTVVDPDALCRVAVAAGTGREMQAIGLTFRQVEAAIMHLEYAYQDVYGRLEGENARQERPHFLSTIGFASIYGFLVLCAAQAAGVTAHLVDHQSIGAEIVRRLPMVAVLTPVHLEYLLDALPAGRQSCGEFYLTVTAGRFSRGLYQRTCGSLTDKIRVVYGADECGGVTMADAATLTDDDMVGKALPWMFVQAVDDQDQPLPAGQEGKLRIRGTGVVSGYLNNPEVSARYFRDGWFYPGDKGVLEADGMVRLRGRVDDLVSLGGEKFDLFVIDAIVREFPGVKDAGTFVVWNEHGAQTLYCAVAAGTGALDGDALSARLRAHYPSLPVLTLLWVEAVPHTVDGRVDRRVLERAMLARGQTQSG